MHVDYTKFGENPTLINNIPLDINEMLFWLYCPISLKDSSGINIPPNLFQFEPLISEVLRDLTEDEVHDNYLYITAKTLWITPDNIGNREGWHSDGFGTNDLNYIWANNNPSRFLIPEHLFELPHSHAESMARMEEIALEYETLIVTYDDYDLMKLTPNVIHNVPIVKTACYRTFFKLSVSPFKYNLKGNSINHHLAYNWEYFERGLVRNHTSHNESDFYNDKK